MDAMPDTRPDGPRYLRKQAAAAGETTATVDVTELLTRLAERTEELAEAKARQKRAEASLKKKKRELHKEREAQDEALRQLEADCSEGEKECHQAEAQFQKLEAQVRRERRARASVEADLKRAQERAAALHQQLQVAWAQLEQGGSGDKRRPWWDRFG
jgi:chromosome segregation ATPase